jgi:hypothetical protein
MAVFLPLLLLWCGLAAASQLSMNVKGFENTCVYEEAVPGQTWMIEYQVSLGLACSLGLLA